MKVPFSSFFLAKQRPALILSNNEFIKTDQDVLVCAITSSPPRSRYEFVLNKRAIVAGHLPGPSTVRPTKIHVVEKTLLVKRIANVNLNSVRIAVQKLHSSLRTN